MSATVFGSSHPAPRRSAAHHRHRDLHRRSRAARHGARGDPAQPARARPHRADRHRARRQARPACSRSTPPRTPRTCSKPMPCAWLMPELGPENRGLPADRQGHRALRRRRVAVVVAENRYQAQDAARLDRRRLRRRCRRSSIRRKPTCAGRAAASRRHSGQPGVSLDGRRRRRRRRVRQGRRRRQGSHHPAAADSDRDGTAVDAGATGSPATGELTLWNTTQNPHIVRFLGIARHRRARRQAAGGRSGSRRRIRQQDRGVPRRVHRDVLLDETGTPGQMDRDAQRELSGDDARARSRAGGRAGGDARRQDSRTALLGVGGHGRVSLDGGARHPDDPARPDAVGSVRACPRCRKTSTASTRTRRRSRPTAAPAVRRRPSCSSG